MELPAVTLVTPKIDAEVKDLIHAAEKLNVQLDIRNVLPDEVTENFNTVVLWRGSSVGTFAKRTAVLQRLNAEHILINPCLAIYPKANRKSFQQEHFKKLSSELKGIPPFVFSSHEELKEAIEKEILLFPFIEKPNVGSRGKSVRVIHSEDELSNDPETYKKSIYQNFIPNDGDYRVFIVGGKALGVIKRTAAENSLINNVSRGGSATNNTNSEVNIFLCIEAEKIAKHFSLLVCGIDIIQDQKTGEFYFLEINTIAEWQGFQKATNIPVAERIISFCTELA